MPNHPKPEVATETYSLTDPGRKCGKCGELLPSEAKLCTACGLDFSTGRVLHTRKEISWRDVASFFRPFVIAGVVVALGWAAWKSRPLLAKQIETQATRAATAEVATRYPPVARGTPIEIPLVSGGSMRGTFAGEEGGEIVIGVADGEIRLAIDLIGEPARTRLSSSLRQIEIERASKERLAADPLMPWLR